MNEPRGKPTGYQQRNLVWQAIRRFFLFRGKPRGIHHPCSLLKRYLSNVALVIKTIKSIETGAFF